MPSCRICHKLCRSNTLLKDRFFREKLQDVICLWVDIDSDSGGSNVCRNCEIDILDFHSFKQQSREVLRRPTRVLIKKKPKSAKKNKRTHSKYEQHDSKTLLSLLDNCDAAIEFPVETLEDFNSSAEPIKAKSLVTTRKKTRRRYSWSTQVERELKQLKPKRQIRRKTDEEKAMSPEEYKRYYYKMVTEKYKKTCEVCGKRLPPDRMEGHINGHRGLQPYSCEFCGLQFNCKLNMRKHVHRNHTGGEQMPCTMCDKMLPSQMALTQHIRAVHKEKKFQCSLCGLKIPNKNSLARHMNIHTQTRDFVCPHCGKAFYCNSVLTIHLRTHSGETPYNCTICPKDFVHRRLYVLHMQKLHPGEPMMRINGTKALKNTLMKKHY